MECVKTIVDSVDTSVSLKLFKNRESSVYAHIFNSEFIMFPMKECKKLENFNHEVRLSSEPYPKDDRPRGQADLDSVNYHRRMIRKNGNSSPIWIAKHNNTYIKLDGVHRLVAANLENKRAIPAFIVTV